MKKILLLMVVVLLASVSVFAQEEQEQEQEKKQIQIQQVQPGSAPKEEESGVDFVMNFTNFGIGLFMPFDGPIVDFSFELLRLGLEGKKANFGFTFSPFNFSGIVGRKGIGEKGGTAVIPIGGYVSFSFINLTLYWNMLSFLDFSDKFFVGPYASFNYLFLNPSPETGEEAFNFKKYMVGAGLQGGIRGVSEKVKYNIFTVETGFRLVEQQGENKAKFYAGIKFDFIMNSLNSKGMFS